MYDVYLHTKSICAQVKSGHHKRSEEHAINFNGILQRKIFHIFACPGSFATKKAYWYYIYSLSFVPFSSGLPQALEKLKNRDKWERFFQLGKSHEILKFYQKIMEFWVSLGLINEYWGNNNNSVIAMQFLVWIDSLKLKW